MKTLLLIFLIFVLRNQHTNAQMVFWQENFEVDGHGSTYTANHQFIDTGNDYFTRSDGTSLSIGNAPIPACNSSYIGGGGKFYMAAEDTDDAACNPCAISGATNGLDYKAVVFDQINTSSYTSLTFKGLFAAGSNCNTGFRYDHNDGAVVSYSIDGGSSWTQAIKFRYNNLAGTASNQQLGSITTIDQTCLIATGNGGFSGCTAGGTETPVGGGNIASFLTTTFQELTFSIPDTPSTVDIKIEMNFDGQGEEFAFDNFRLEGTAIILPIELVNFSAYLTNHNSVKLDWETVSEISNDFFVIERSVNGVNWESVIKIDGAGNSSALLQYSTQDENPYDGTSYYRLKQIDFNGDFTYSPIKRIYIDKLKKEPLIYPNPTAGDFVIDLGVKYKSVTVNILDINRKVIQTHSFHESQLLNLKLEEPRGVYSVVVNTGNKRVLFRLIKE